MKRIFVDRERELRYLEERFAENKPHLVVVYGRRRVGKTELLKRFIEGKACVYFLAARTSIRDNLAELRRRIAEATGRRYFEKLEVDSLGELLRYYWEEVERPCLVIDEFGYLVELDSGVLSDLQRAWDEFLSKKSAFLVLCGSTISTIEVEVLGRKSPLYGRRTGSWEVKPLDFRWARALLPRYGFEDAVKAWAVAGGVPLYLKELDDSKTPEENIRDAVFTKGRLLYDEGYFLLREELREPATYLTVLKYIALGYATVGKLSGAAGLDKGNLMKYLSVLESLGLVRHVVPYGQRRKGAYAVADNYMWFWLKFVLPNRGDLELGLAEEVLNRESTRLEQHYGLVFEQLVRDLISAGLVKLPFKPKYVGQWWRGDAQIDVVALDEENALFAEVKWGKADRRDFENLVEKSQRIDVGARRRHYLIFARGGTAEGLVDFEELDKVTRPPR
ncbi:MAG: ATP-binding protein [Pyrobaculum sp.]